MTTQDDRTVRYPLLTDEPVEVRHPRRKARQLALLFAAAIVVCSSVAGYVSGWLAYHHAEAHTDRRIAVLERDLAARQAARARQDVQTKAVLDQYRHTVCALAEGRTGPEFDRLRADYGCAALTGPPPTGTPSPHPGPSPATTGGARTRRGATGPAGLRGPAGPPGQATPAPVPAPPATVPTLPPCLPLLPCL